VVTGINAGVSQVGMLIIIVFLMPDIKKLAVRKPSKAGCSLICVDIIFTRQGMTNSALQGGTLEKDINRASARNLPGTLLCEHD